MKFHPSLAAKLSQPFHEPPDVSTGKNWEYQASAIQCKYGMVRLTSKQTRADQRRRRYKHDRPQPKLPKSRSGIQLA